MDDQTWRSRRTFRAAATTAALAATILVGGAAAAQDAGTSPAVPTLPGDTGTDQETATSPGGGAPNGQRQRPGRVQGGRGGTDARVGGPGMGGPSSGGGRSTGPGGSAMAASRGSVSVTAVDGTSLTLQTSDGWTRTIDTTGVVLTAGDAAITLADIAVGDEVRIAQTRNADGSYTVTGIALQPMRVSGTVATVGTDSFTLTGADGGTTTVYVSSSTTWSIRGDSDPTLADLTVGTAVDVTGDSRADGGIDATRVTVR